MCAPLPLVRKYRSGFIVISFGVDNISEGDYGKGEGIGCRVADKSEGVDGSYRGTARGVVGAG